MPERIFVTGLGIICSIGNNISQSLISLKNQSTGIGNNSYINTRHLNLPVGEVKLSDQEIHSEVIENSDKQLYTRTTLMALKAIKEAFPPEFSKEKSQLRKGIISATTVGGMRNGEDHYIEFLSGKSNPERIESFDCGNSTEIIADKFNIKDYIATISTACSSSANSIITGARLIRNHIIDIAIAGGTDALCKFTINGFKSLEILDSEQCKPFDEHRCGLNIGEGAAYLVLESESTADPAQIICEFKGYGIANDAYHQTASSPNGNGAFLAMKEALLNACLEPEEISYLNAHGTATEINDLSEGKAIEQLFSTHFPLISSTKAFTGHALGAAGAIEAVFSILAIQHQMAWPNLNFKTKMKELHFDPLQNLSESEKIAHVMSNSLGFGGHNSSLIFSKY